MHSSRRLRMRCTNATWRYPPPGLVHVCFSLLTYLGPTPPFPGLACISAVCRGSLTRKHRRLARVSNRSDFYIALAQMSDFHSHQVRRAPVPLAWGPTSTRAQPVSHHGRQVIPWAGSGDCDAGDGVWCECPGVRRLPGRAWDWPPSARQFGAKEGAAFNIYYVQ